MVRVRYDESGERVEKQFTSDDPRDLTGPPHMVVEHVFDEYAIAGCYATADDVPD
jgi:hypothetical protein